MTAIRGFEKSYSVASTDVGVVINGGQIGKGRNSGMFFSTNFSSTSNLGAGAIAS